MHWYTKLALVFGGMGVLFVALVVYEERAGGAVVWKTKAPGDQGRLSVLNFEIREPNSPYVLTVRPWIESGWGTPDVRLDLRIQDPTGTEVLTVGEDTVFGRAILGPDNIRSYADYEERFPFRSGPAGAYTVSLQVLSPHVASVSLAVGRKNGE